MWDASLVLAEFILERQWIVLEKSVIELGCGCSALPSIAAAASGAAVCVASDYDRSALELARANAAANGAAALETIVLDWREPRLGGHPAFDVVLAADCVFASSSAAPLLQTLLLGAPETMLGHEPCSL